MDIQKGIWVNIHQKLINDTIIQVVTIYQINEEIALEWEYYVNENIFILWIISNIEKFLSIRLNFKKKNKKIL